MKQYIRRVVLMLCMMTCFLSLSAFSSKAEEIKLMPDPHTMQVIIEGTENLIKELTDMDKNEAGPIETQLLAKGEIGLASGVKSWLSVMDETGALTEIRSSVVSMDAESYICTTDLMFEKCAMEFEAIYVIDEKENIFTPTSLSFTPVDATAGMNERTESQSQEPPLPVEPEYTMGEKLTKAGINTLLGMGTVFCVLILICLLITCFKFIAIFEKKMKEKEEAATAKFAPVAIPAPAAAAPVAENLTDDLELVAVITAAIAAAENTSTDGLVVRSIKRVPSAKWKRA